MGGGVWLVDIVLSIGLQVFLKRILKSVLAKFRGPFIRFSHSESRHLILSATGIGKFILIVSRRWYENGGVNVILNFKLGK